MRYRATLARMCGRYSLANTGRSQLPAGLGEMPAYEPRYNIAPQQQAPVVRHVNGKHEVQELVWGFRPAWLKDKRKAQINARAETLFTKPLFRQSALNRRCLVLATGWYEWQKQPAGPKLPYAFHLEHDGMFAFAGIWTRWHGDENDTEESYAIVTTDASPLAAAVHSRMPVVLTGESCEQWLDMERNAASNLDALLKPYRGEDLRAFRVSSYVNKPSNTGADCIRPV